MDINLHVYSIESKIFSGKVTRVQLPGMQGRFEIRKNHTPLVSVLVKGDIIYYEADSKSIIKMTNGLVMAKNNIIHVWLFV